MPADQARSDQTTPLLVTRASEEAAQLLLSHARHTWGDSFREDAWRVAWMPDTRPFERESPFNALIIPWAIYLWDGGDDETEGPGSVAADFLATPMATAVADRTRAYMEACRAEPLTFWQVEAVEPGVGLTLRDMATGTERFVHERSGSQTIEVWDLVFGQVVGVDDIYTLSMNGPYPLPPGRFREPVERFLADEVDAECLADYGKFLLEFYFDCADELLHPPMPKVTNMDGEPLEWTTSTYRFPPQQRGRLLGRLDQMRNIETDTDEGEDLAAYRWIGHRKEGPLEQVSRGRIMVGTDTLTTECNSRKRDRLLRERLLKTLDDLVELAGTEYKPLDMEAMQHAAEVGPGEGRGLDPASLPPDVQQQMRQMVDDMHMRWADERVPALGNRTPREAVKTPAGRREVAQMVNDYENMAARNPQDAFDFNRLRRELGLELE